MSVNPKVYPNDIFWHVYNVHITKAIDHIKLYSHIICSTMHLVPKQSLAVLRNLFLYFLKNLKNNSKCLNLIQVDINGPTKRIIWNPEWNNTINKA